MSEKEYCAAIENYDVVNDDIAIGVLENGYFDGNEIYATPEQIYHALKAVGREVVCEDIEITDNDCGVITLDCGQCNFKCPGPGNYQLILRRVDDE
jgi:hypothetical protein